MEKENKEITELPVGEKYLLTVKEAALYFNIGQKKIRRMAEDGLGTISLYSGNRYLIKRKKFEEFLDQTMDI